MHKILYQISDSLLSSAGRHLSTVLSWCSHSKPSASIFKVSRGLYLLPGFPSQHSSVPELRFPSLFPSRSLSPAMLIMLHGLCLLSHSGYLATRSQHFPSTCQGMARGTEHYTTACVCPFPPGSWQASALHFPFLNQFSVSVDLFTFCSTTGWTA